MELWGHAGLLGLRRRPLLRQAVDTGHEWGSGSLLCIMFQQLFRSYSSYSCT